MHILQYSKNHTKVFYSKIHTKSILKLLQKEMYTMVQLDQTKL